MMAFPLAVLPLGAANFVPSGLKIPPALSGMTSISWFVMVVLP
jgi:hypothetical protein